MVLSWRVLPGLGVDKVNIEGSEHLFPKVGRMKLKLIVVGGREGRGLLLACTSEVGGGESGSGSGAVPGTPRRSPSTQISASPSCCSPVSGR